MNNPTIHHVHPTGLALSLTAGIIYIICGIFVAIWPEGAIFFFSDWFHGLDLKRIASPGLSFGPFFRGLLTFMVFTYLSGFLFAWLYNRCLYHCIKRGWIKQD